MKPHLKELYDLDISDSTIRRISDKIMPFVKEWQERPLQEVYAVVYVDAIHYHVRSEGRIVKRAVYIVLGIDMDGKKNAVGMYVGKNEGAKFWLSIINGLKNHGVQDILIACGDGLNGFPQAIEAVYPKTEIRQCIIHQIQNTTNYVSYKDLEKLMADLKMVYASPDEVAAMEELEFFGEKNGTINIRRSINRGVNAGLHFQPILNIPMKYGSLFIQQMQLKDSTGSCVKSPKARLHFHTLTTC